MWLYNFVMYIKLFYVILNSGPGHVTFWRLCTDQELEKEKLAKLARQSQSKDESLSDPDVSTATSTRQDDVESEEKTGVVKMLLESVIEDQRKLIPGRKCLILR